MSSSFSTTKLSISANRWLTLTCLSQTSIANAGAIHLHTLQKSLIALPKKLKKSFIYYTFFPSTSVGFEGISLLLTFGFEGIPLLLAFGIFDDVSIFDDVIRSRGSRAGNSRARGRMR